METYLIELKGLIRFKLLEKLKLQKNTENMKLILIDFNQDLEEKKEQIKFSDLELIFKDLKSLFEKRGFIINWKELENKV